MCLDGHPLTAEKLKSIIKRTASHFGLDPALFSSHSLRSGGATALHKSGAGVEIIMRECRWASVQSVLYYLRMDATTAAIFSPLMLPAEFSPSPAARLPSVTVTHAVRHV